MLTRRKAREIAVQSLYHMEMNPVEVTSAVETVIAMTEEELGETLDKDENALQFVHTLITGSSEHKDRIDQILERYLKSWKVDRLSRVDRQVLRVAIYEMLILKENPPKVVVNEAIDLSKLFGTDESGKFVNGVLGKMLTDETLA